MTAYNPRTRSFPRRAWLAGVLALLALAGCKSKDGGSAPISKPRDPLVYGPTRIPPQNVPVSERGGVGSAVPKIDPLKDRTVGIGGGGDKTGVGYADGPERFKGTHVPGPATTPAALAAKTHDGEELKIDTPDFRVPLRQVGGTLPVGGTAAPPAEGLDHLYMELAKHGVKPAARSLTQENGEYTFRAAVPISDNGAKRQYAGVGRSAAEAVKQVLDQIVSDRN